MKFKNIVLILITLLIVSGCSNSYKFSEREFEDIVDNSDLNSNQDSESSSDHETTVLNSNSNNSDVSNSGSSVSSGSSSGVIYYKTYMVDKVDEMSSYLGHSVK